MSFRNVRIALGIILVSHTHLLSHLGEWKRKEELDGDKKIFKSEKHRVAPGRLPYDG